MYPHFFLCAALLFLAGLPARAEDNELAAYYAKMFEETELTVRPSPADSRQLPLAAGEKVLDFDVSPLGPEVYSLARNAEGRIVLRVWPMDGGVMPADWPLPAGFEAKAISLHPRGEAFFLSGTQGQESVILRVAQASGEWQASPIYRTDKKLRRLMVGPRPFSVGYRLFFGYAGDDGHDTIRSVTENGEREYQVIGSEAGYVNFDDVGEPPAKLLAPDALPAAFRPLGNEMIWQDKAGCFYQADYYISNWKPSLQRLDAHPCGGSLTSTPNGLGLIHWQKDKPGVRVYLYNGQEISPQAQDVRFLGTPSSVPDGRGLVGLIETPTGQSLVYVPIQVPLADVINAQLFVDQPGAVAPLAAHGGVFRATDNEQMYSLYESELYGPSLPARPYLATTDVFWEIFAAAYEGLFVLQEKQRAMPAFWDFVEAADAYYHAPEAKKAPQSVWAGVFEVLRGLRTNRGLSEEAVHMRDARVAYSRLFGREVDYSELKPRGHYSLSPELSQYFKAFKYLAEIAPKAGAPVEELQKLPAALQAKAQAWINGYLAFIAPPRRPLVWQNAAAFSLPAYAVPRPLKDPLALFPLSWGFDNEVLNSTVFHPDWPASEQITGTDSQPRLLPSGLEVAAALGSPAAMDALRDEFARYPALGPALQALRARSPAAKGGGDLYQKWLAALAVQWADKVSAPQFKPELWQAKRLQTGLASWATLRHATLLVNERAGAEAGEAGFEEIVMRPPRGYVEPDPATFRALAGLFEAAAEVAGHVLADPALRQGVQARLAESAAKARQFAGMAEKQARGEALTPAEYGDILYLARIAEHHFLVYKALANPVEEYAIANPDPIPKVADVAGNPDTGLLLGAVGKPLEWTQIVPYFGRRELVKGAVYSYYEFTADAPMDDAEWREKLPQAEPPAWFMPWLK